MLARLPVPDSLLIPCVCLRLGEFTTLAHCGCEPAFESTPGFQGSCTWFPDVLSLESIIS
eukprot:617648-Pelagomonas_calceolata.AAC.1